MKRFSKRLTIFGMLAVLFCFVVTLSNGDSDESKLEQKTDDFLKAGDHESALKLIDGFIQEHPEKPTGHAMSVRVLAADGQTDKGLKAYYQFYKLSETLSEELLLELLRGALNHDDINVRWKAAQALGGLGDERAVPALIEDIAETLSGENTRPSKVWDVIWYLWTVEVLVKLSR